MPARVGQGVEVVFNHVEEPAELGFQPAAGVAGMNPVTHQRFTHPRALMAGCCQAKDQIHIL